MNYFVTGATGFIGHNLVARLLQREGTIYALVRAGSRGRLEELRTAWGADGARVVPIAGDLSQPALGVSEEDLLTLRGEIDHFFHLAAIYDMAAGAEAQEVANVEGTRHAVELAAAIKAGCFHQISSIAAAGLYRGTWTEDMFDQAEDLDTHPYFRTKHESERVVREDCSRPWRVYRPGIVVGDSRTGAIDKIDGPYYMFKLLQRARRVLPSWLPTVGVEGGEINIVPVDYVAAAIDHIAHQPDLDGRAFHLTDPQPKTAGEVLNLFARAACGAAARLRHHRSGSRPPPRRAEVLPAGQAGGEDGAGRGRHPGWCPQLRQLPDPLRLDRGPCGAGRLGDRGAAAGELRRPRLGLLGAQARSRPVQGPLALGGGAGQGGADHRRLLGDRQSGRGQGRRRGRDCAAGRPLGRQAGGDEGGDRDSRRCRPHPPLRHVQDRGHRADGRGGARLPRAGRHPRQQRRPLDPPLGQALLRPLPRLRADDPGQLLRPGAADPRLAALDAGAQIGPHHQHQFDRHPDQPTPLLGLRRLEGGAGRLQPGDRL